MMYVKRVPKGAIDLGVNWYAHSYRTENYFYHVHHEGEANQFIERGKFKEDL